MAQYSGITGKRVLITGATSGLGFAMAKALLSKGAKVFVTGRNLEKVNIMAQDLASWGITVNMLLPGGATETGMVPEEFPASMRAQLLSPDVMAEPILFLCSDEAKGLNDQRIVAKDFTHWKDERSRSSG